MNLESIKQEIVEEFKKREVTLETLEFNKRGQDIVMNYVYSSLNDCNQEVHTAPRSKDPVFLDIASAREIIKFLDDKQIPYTKRNDDFI
ncbi:hypothetical protein [Macrococcus sp. DPC7161]|uniref:hypothetical protein n=1 Tax=Macrococcus sp. DPC7161 TaxID=2507060 RepID=UPI00100BC7D7|nr:hypothetical protein [Macrococcus sp. DPC7161]RXK18843.1 hypothetical protein ER639_00605 [Macrococcus sp. DPC7161]